jgi:uncharacterized membrane protein
MKNETAKFIKRMKGMLALAITATLVVYGFYFFNFFSEFKLSDKNEVWGTFGDYVGGTLNPFLSFLSLIAISLTLNLQIQDIQNSKDESKRNDIHRLIEKLAERINKNYIKEIELNNGSETYLIRLSSALLNDESSRNQTIARICNERENRSSSAFTTIFAIENDLKRLCVYIDIYQSLNQHNDSTMKDFYKAEFEDLISPLILHDWITNTDTKKILFEFLYTN